jgi:hypothetical protein
LESVAAASDAVATSIARGVSSRGT